MVPLLNGGNLVFPSLFFIDYIKYVNVKIKGKPGKV